MLGAITRQDVNEDLYVNGCRAVSLAGLSRGRQVQGRRSIPMPGQRRRVVDGASPARLA